ncbi:MAG: hypothetical protein RLZZ400_824 [Actinomycetota bacterium]|jgi:F-type H+-transporting ATPase subunit delta
MASSTRQAMAAAKDALEAHLGDASLKFAEELFSIGAAVSSSSQLRNILSDPSGAEKAKLAALEAVFGKSVSAQAIKFAATLSGMRWSRGSDLATAFSKLAVVTVAAIATKSKKLGDLEQEVFALRQVVDSDRELQQALSSRQASLDSKLALIDRLAKSASSEAQLLAHYAVVESKSVKLSLVLESFSKQLAEYAQRLVANVTVAAPLTAAQLKKLEEVLAKNYGTALHLNVEIDPSIVGGVKVTVSGEIIDGSVASRLNQAKLQLA